jgi:UPF0755 protein
MSLKRKLGTLAALGALAWGFVMWRVERPYQGFQGETFVDLAHGTSTGAMADELAAAGVIRSRWDFLLARLVHRRGVLQAGEYRFNRADSAADIVNRIARGDIFYYELVVPEGKNMFDIGAAVEQLGLFKAVDFVAQARKPEIIRDLDPQAPTLEGYLFPNTYRLSRHTTPERLCRMMTARFRETWKSLHTDAGVHDTITLASMVEREGKLAEERPRIAGVFTNRLRIGMHLDCDPTAAYAALLEDRFTGTIRHTDLESDHLYNTYRHAGLPPGPIANPGVSSIRAALAPADTDALYFVARGDHSGAHEFSSNIAAHEKAVDRYRRALRQ